MTTDGQSRWYVTTAIPFVNSTPHIGFALEAVLADTVARYHRLKGEDVWFLTGTDENSLKNVQAAEREGITTEALVERNAAAFRGLREVLDLSFDDFIRTSSEDRHLRGVEKLWHALEKNGDLYKKPFEGLYCVGCEQFYDPAELVDGLCPEHRTAPEHVSEENWFFRLSRYGSELLALIQGGQMAIVPDKRRNEIVAFIQRGLNDFSVSRSAVRSRGWGIPVPGDPSQVMYVWFDALGNYITALGYADDAAGYHRYWIENPNRVHVIGKGITRFHAVYWPAMLLAAGVLLPTTIFVHGYVTIGGEKISKSLGNVVDPVALVDAYGTDPLRYFLLAHVRSTEDGDFTLERFIRAANADLANQVGNLLNRTVNMIGRYAGGLVPNPGPAGPVDHDLLEAGRTLADRIDVSMGRFETHEAIGAIWDLVDRANKYVVTVEPWALAKAREAGGPAADDAEERLRTCLYNLAESLRLVGVFMSPFLPGSSRKLLAQLGVDGVGPWPICGAWGGLIPGSPVAAGEILFPRIEVEEAADAV